MSAGFTPGPWHLYCDDKDGAFEITAAIPGEGGGMVVVQRGGMRHRAELAKANANLIAAAPDLYEVLDALVSYLLGGDFENAVGIAEHDGLARLAKARAEQVHSDPLPKEVGR